MCTGGRLLADFTAGTETAPDVPDVVRACLTVTPDGRWVVWARKLARPKGDGYGPLTGGPTYPPDAVAICRVDSTHDAPQPSCSCGFHAVSRPRPDLFPGSGTEALFAMVALRVAGGGQAGASGRPVPAGLRALEVVLTGRVLALKWRSDGVLFRAARQTVVRSLEDRPTAAGPDDLDGTLARVRTPQPSGEGPYRLRVPRTAPSAVEVDDDAGFCALVDAPVIGAGRSLVACR